MTSLSRAICACIALAAVASTADPAVAAQRFFHSPSGNISCELDYRVRGIPPVAYCQTESTPKSVTLSPNGRIKRCSGERCLGNGPQEAFTLAYGRAVRLGPFRCRSARDGMTCTVVATGRGFRISRSAITAIAG